METVSVLLIGAAYAATPGPVSIETMRHGLHNGLRGALAVQAGSALGLTFYAMLALAGAGALLASDAWRPLFNLAAMTLLIGLGFSAIRHRHALPHFDANAPPPTRSALASGALLSLASPLDLLFWLSFGAGVWQPRSPGAPASLAAHPLLAAAVGCLLASLLVALFAAFCGAHLSVRGVCALTWLCGLALIAFGLQLGLSIL